MFEPRLRPIEPLQVQLSWQQYEDAIEHAGVMSPVMQQFIDRALDQIRGCACKWEFNTTDMQFVRYEITEVSIECPWHVHRP